MRRPHLFVTAPRRNTPYITRYIRIRGETPATSPNRRLRLKRKYIELSENPRDHQREEAAKVMTLLARFNTLTSTKRIVDEELGLALNRTFGRPAFPTRTEKFGFGANFALTGEIKQFTLVGGTDELRGRLEVALGTSITELEARVNAVSEYELLKQPPRAYASTIPGYDPYAARREADRELASFNVMANALRTNPDL